MTTERGSPEPPADAVDPRRGAGGAAAGGAAAGGVAAGGAAAGREAVATASLLAIFLFGGMAVGLAIAVTAGGGSVAATIVGFFALPLAFGAAMSAWRTVIGAWFVARLGRAALRSRGDEARFRAETRASFQSIRDAGPAALPGTWVFLPTTLFVGLAAALLMAIAADGDPVTAGVLILAASVAMGSVLRRLARSGRLPIPEE